MLEKNPEKRATLEQIAKCNWITNYEKEQVDFLIQTRHKKQNDPSANNFVDFGNIQRIIPRIQTPRLINDEYNFDDEIS